MCVSVSVSVSVRARARALVHVRVRVHVCLIQLAHRRTAIRAALLPGKRAQARCGGGEGVCRQAAPR